MPTILALTVGGSCAPIVTAIRDYQPDFVVFFSSSGPRGSHLTIDGLQQKPCQGEASILEQTGLAEGRYLICDLTEPDVLHVCYEEIRLALAKAVESRIDWHKVADYTGGTKTMTAALVLVAVESGWNLSLVKGARTDLVKVIDGTEMASLVNTWEVRVKQQMRQAERLFNSYAYASAGELLESLLRAAPLSPDLQRDIQRLVALCRAFDAWDRFDHQRARQLLAPHQSLVVPQWRFLKTLTGQQAATGYEPVFDLWLNAERRAERERYDDAVARLYRALEMLAQIRLSQREPALDAGSLTIERLPEALQLRYQTKQDFSRAMGYSDKIALGLREDFELLTELNDPLGLEYARHSKQLLSALSARNASILAHGSVPLTSNQYQDMRQQVLGLIEQGMQALNLKLPHVQFPRLQDGQIKQWP